MQRWNSNCFALRRCGGIVIFLLAVIPLVATAQSGSIDGHIRYYGSGAAVSGATVQLAGTMMSTDSTDDTGHFGFAALTQDLWQVQPQKLGDGGSAVSVLDAVYILQALMGMRTFTPAQAVACDVSGNGTLSAFDAVLILEYLSGMLPRFPVAESCGSDWVFLPTADTAANQEVVDPQSTAGSCTRGSISFGPLAGAATNQDFSAAVFGDCTGNWQPPPPTAAATATPTATENATATAVPSLTPTLMASATSSPTSSATAMPSLTATRSPTAVPTATASTVPAATATATLTRTATASATSTPTPSVTSTPSNSPTRSPTSTPTRTASTTSTPTLSATATPSNTPTRSPTATVTASVTPTASMTLTMTPTRTATASATRTRTQTRTATRTATPTVTATATVAPSGSPTGPTLGGCQMFPADNPWNHDVSGDPVDPNSATYIANISLNATHLHPDFGSPADYGIPYIVVPGTQPMVPITFTDYGDESDPGPYPVPSNAPVEAGSDHHVLVLDSGNCTLYEMFNASKDAQGTGWSCSSGAIFDLNSNALRPDSWTSADAAGLPILPGLVRYDEVAAGAINHAVRFTVWRAQRAWVHPATHYGVSTDPNFIPMGGRLRLKATYDISHFTGESRVILEALRKYGMIVADAGSSWYITGSTDPRWDDNDLDQLKSVPDSAFEVVQLGTIYRP